MRKSNPSQSMGRPSTDLQPGQQPRAQTQYHRVEGHYQRPHGEIYQIPYGAYGKIPEEGVPVHVTPESILTAMMDLFLLPLKFLGSLLHKRHSKDNYFGFIRVFLFSSSFHVVNLLTTPVYCRN